MGRDESDAKAIHTNPEPLISIPAFNPAFGYVMYVMR